MHKILAIVDWYMPGFKAGGPIRSVSNLISALGGDDWCEFYVFTRDRDLKAPAPFADVPKDTWTRVGNGQVFYTADISMANLSRRVAEIAPDIIYLNSFFSRLTIRILMLRRLGKLPPASVVLAPRGEFSPGALASKKFKKAPFMRLAALVGLYRNILWHASAEREKLEMQKVFADLRLAGGGCIGIASPIHVASDFSDFVPHNGQHAVVKQSGEASFIFVSRVSPTKNLLAAIEMLSGISGNVAFDIYGPAEDEKYFARCQHAVAQAPPNVKIRFMGPLPHEEAVKKFSEYHFFLFPTLGENFGHVIIESLGAGCPVVLSDQTPWSHLEDKNIGWDLPLDDRTLWRRVLQKCVDIDNAVYQRMSSAAQQFVREWVNSPVIKEQNLALFRASLNRPADKPQGEEVSVFQ